jgi:hypothetical protein
MWHSRYRLVKASLRYPRSLAIGLVVQPTMSAQRSSAVRVSYSGKSAAQRREAGNRRDGKDLEGEQSPGRIGRRIAGNGDPDVTDLSMEQRLEVDDSGARASRFESGNGSESIRGDAREERHGGNDRGDTERLSIGKILRGVRNAPSGNVPVEPIRCFGSDYSGSDIASAMTMATVCAKYGEPQDRQRDAISPQTSERRKPSRWCKTTRTEQGSN